MSWWGDLMAGFQGTTLDNLAAPITQPQSYPGWEAPVAGSLFAIGGGGALAGGAGFLGAGAGAADVASPSLDAVVSGGASGTDVAGAAAAPGSASLDAVTTGTAAPGLDATVGGGASASLDSLAGLGGGAPLETTGTGAVDTGLGTSPTLSGTTSGAASTLAPPTAGAPGSAAATAAPAGTGSADITTGLGGDVSAGGGAGTSGGAPALAQPAAAPAAPAAAPTTPPAVKPPDPGIMDQVGTAFKAAPASFVKSALSPGTLLAAGGMGYNILKGNQQPTGQPQLNQAADQLYQQGTQLSQMIQSGVPPAALSAGIDQNANDAITAAISSVAAGGGDTNPATNQTLAQNIQNIKNQAVTLKAQLAMQIGTTGVNEVTTAANEYTNLINAANTGNQATQRALSQFAAAMAPVKTAA